MIGLFDERSKINGIDAMIAPNLIDAGSNDRKHFDPLKLAKLADSIQKDGLAQKPLVRPTINGRYQIVAGERRIRAMRDILKWTEIPCQVADMSDEQASAIMLAENTSREDLDPIEEANGYQNRIDTYKWSIEKVAEVAGRKVAIITNRLSLLKLATDIQPFVANGNLPLGHAEAMTKLDANRQRIALRIYNKTGLSAVKFKLMCSELLCQQSQDELFNLETFWKEQKAGTEFPKRGKKARTGAPTRNDLPPIRMIDSRDTAGALFDRFITDLVASGHDSEAAAVGNLYQALVKSNFISVPEKSELLGE